MPIIHEDEGIELDGVQITSETALSFLTDVSNADAACPFCGSTHWQISMSPGDGKYLYFPTTKGTKPQDDKLFPFFVVACMKCSFARPHSLYAISNWLQSKATNKAKGSEDDKRS